MAVDAIPGVAYASITRRRDTGFQTLGATHPDAVANDRKQYETGSGPCLDAAEDGATVILVPYSPAIRGTRCSVRRRPRPAW